MIDEQGNEIAAGDCYDDWRFGSPVYRVAEFFVDGRIWFAVNGRRSMFPVSEIAYISHVGGTPEVSTLNMRDGGWWHVLTETLPPDLRP